MATSFSPNATTAAKTLLCSKALPPVSQQGGIPEDAGMSAHIMLSGSVLMLAGWAQTQQVAGECDEPGWLLPSHGCSQLRITGLPWHAVGWEKQLFLYKQAIKETPLQPTESLQGTPSDSVHLSPFSLPCSCCSQAEFFHSTFLFRKQVIHFNYFFSVEDIILTLPGAMQLLSLCFHSQVQLICGFSHPHLPSAELC